MLSREMEIKMKYLSYPKTGKINQTLCKRALQVLPNLSLLTEIKKLEELEVVSLEEIKEFAKKFYAKYFDIHDIDFITMSIVQEHDKDFRTAKSELEAYKLYFSLMKKTSPFEIPIILEDRDSMQGRLEKPLMIIPGSENFPNRKIPIGNIVLGNQLRETSYTTYVHEIAHSQQESLLGYAEEYINKEVISIFLEKIAALELDPTGKVLRHQERVRFAYSN